MIQPLPVVAGIMCLRRVQRAAYALDGVWDVDECGQNGVILAYEHVEWVGVRGVDDALGFDVEVQVSDVPCHR